MNANAVVALLISGATRSRRKGGDVRMAELKVTDLTDKSTLAEVVAAVSVPNTHAAAIVAKSIADLTVGVVNNPETVLGHARTVAVNMQANRIIGLLGGLQ